MTREEWIAEARSVLEGLKQRRARVRVPANIELAESDARSFIYEIRRLIENPIHESGGALDHEEFIKKARELEDEARELIADPPP
jgi:hypothetical protein